ncbi:hypothetical protein WR25_06201 [Diploscapter pachys]|uniref:Uncharacterized protein n=1 Tax=Diploscapter pachys TaxID=2018661 RepID=A0A2A2KMU3_9BILA|nr:hypothetical protein WR25_06201 [Diploscapter pachys]
MGLCPGDDCLRKWVDSETGLVDRNAASDEEAAARLIPNAIHKSSMRKHSQPQQPHEKVLSTKERWRCRRKHPSQKRRLEANRKWKCEMRLISNAAHNGKETANALEIRKAACANRLHNACIVQHDGARVKDVRSDHVTCWKNNRILGIMTEIDL